MIKKFGSFISKFKDLLAGKCYIDISLKLVNKANPNPNSINDSAVRERMLESFRALHKNSIEFAETLNRVQQGFPKNKNGEQMSIKGKFITFEGLDGSGKTTAAKWLVEMLKAAGKEVIFTREPGGSPLGEKLREIVLNEYMDAETQALLMFASRRDHVERIIKPALESGIWVVCDRFTDSSFALQGFGGGVNLVGLSALEAFVHPHFQPDITLLLDLPAEIAKERNADTGKKDRFELEGIAYHNRVRNGFLHRQLYADDRIKIIDANQDIYKIRIDIANIINPFLVEHSDD